MKDKRIIIIVAVILVIAALLAGAIVFLNRKSRVPTRPTAEQIKIVTAKTVDLTQNTKNLKQKIIASPIREDRGDKYLVQSREFTIIYVPGPDQFYVQINNNPVQQNKEKAENWFKDKGFKKEELCGLGIHFELTYPDVTQKEITNFNSAASGCPSL